MTECSIFDIFDQTAGFYWSITLLLKSPFLMCSWCRYTTLCTCILHRKH